MTRLCLLIGFVLASFLSCSHGIWAQDSLRGSSYSIVALTNRTSRSVTYDYSWGDGKTRSKTLKPGETYRHWWECGPDCKGCSPKMSVSFNWTIHNRGTVALGAGTYKLKPKRSQNTNLNGAKRYYFGWREGHVDLFDPDK